MSEKLTKSNEKNARVRSKHIHLVPDSKPSNVLELLHPGSFAKFHNQPHDLPPFQIIHCKGGRCLVRQQAWGRNVQWEVEHYRLRST